MIISGKCPPEPDKLAQISDIGFDHVELYLAPDYLDAYEETLQTCRDADIEVTSIHTPHVMLDDAEYLRLADDLANDLDAFLVVHSIGFHLSMFDQLEDKVEFTAPHGYESHPGNSQFIIENALFDKGRQFVLDTAHLYASEPDYLTVIDDLLVEHGDDIPLVHLVDGTRTNDGFQFGEGTMDMEAVSQLIKKKFDGIVVLEVMPDEQAEALRKFQSY